MVKTVTKNRVFFFGLVPRSGFGAAISDAIVYEEASLC